MTYNEAEDSRLSYDVAIAEIRKRKIATGEIVPRPGDPEFDLLAGEDVSDE